MATNLKVVLSEKLQNTLSSTSGGGEIGVWALHFDNTGAPQATPLSKNTAGTAEPTTITLPTAFDGGKVYLIYQSVASSADLLTFGPTGIIKQESDLTWGFSDQHQFRYDSFEVSLLGGAADAGNLTSLNAFGIPMSIDITYPNGSATQTRGYNVQGQQIFQDIEAQFTTQGGLVHKFTTGPLNNQIREAAGPATILTSTDAQNQPLKGVSASDFYPILESIGNALGTDSLPDMRIGGQFNGAASVDYVVGQSSADSYSNWHNAAFYSYVVSYKPAPAIVHKGSLGLADNPLSWASDNPNINVAMADVSQYRLNETIVLSGVTGNVGAYAPSDINGVPFVIKNVESGSNVLVVFPANPADAKNAPAAGSGGGGGVNLALPIGTDPLASTAGQAYITVTDANASLYAKTGTEVTFSGVTTGVDVYSASYLNSTKFTVSKILSDTQYEIVAAGLPTAATGVSGGGQEVAPTYTRPYAGTFVFTPDSNSQVQGTIEISSLDLANSIYSTLGKASVLGPGGIPFEFTQLVNTVGATTTDLDTGANNQWGAFFVKLITGFMGGYFGSTGAALNPLLGASGQTNLNHNWNFDPTYAFNSNLVNTWTPDSDKYGDGRPFDAYAKIFFDSTNSYGNGYSDALMSLFQQGGPLIATGYPVALPPDTSHPNGPFTANGGSPWVTVYDPNAANYRNGDLVTFAGATPFAGIDMTKDVPLIAGTKVKAYTITNLDVAAKTYQVMTTTNATGGANQTGGGSGVVAGYNVPNITLTLYDDNEPVATGKTQGETQLYTPTEIYNTPFSTPVAPQGAGHSSDLSLQFSLGLGQFRPASDVKVSLKLYTGTGDAFETVTFDNTQSVFQTWTYTASGASGTLAAAGQASPSGTILQINGLPYTTGTNWYQLQFESADSRFSRAYNIYLDAVVGSGIVNPAFTGNPAGAIAVDGLASYSFANFPAEQYLRTPTLPLVFNMFNGGTLSMDPRLLEQITDQAVINAASNSALWPQPVAPVLGTGSASSFALWGGSSGSAVLGTPYNATALAAVTTAFPVFSWYGGDEDWLTYNVDNAQSGVIGAYTNKIGALHVAQVTFVGPNNPAPVKGTADLDGRWVTSAASGFFNGSYTAVMKEYLASDTGFTTPLSVASLPLSFTVAGQSHDFQAPSGASFLSLTPGSDPGGGTWLKLAATGSTLFNGTLLAYATQSDGTLIGRDGQPTTSLADAVLARIGAVKFDDGSPLYSGEQTVYLGVGQELHFATQTAAGTIDLLPNVLVSGSTSVAQISLSGPYGSFSLTATPDNIGSVAAQMGLSQNAHNQPWVHLNQGQTVTVAAAGSAADTNTLRFVRFDVDPSTGGLSVGNVAYGNTDAFRAAVVANLDPNYALQAGGGNFVNATNWTAASGSGFYAPVLQAASGNVFVIGTANVDGQEHIRVFGQNTFGFEDRTTFQGGDFDYNDLVVKLIAT